MPAYRDRTAAGQALVPLVQALAPVDPVVLALPRGGVPVAAVVARALGAPLDLVMVRKIGVPAQPELAAAAVVDGPAPDLVVNDAIARRAGLDRADLDRLARPQLDLIARRRGLYLKDRPPVPLMGRTAIVVDDGIATGATMRAALRAVRRQSPARIVLAVPVAARETLDLLRPLVDAVACPLVPDDLVAIGAYYDRFDQTTDDEVVALLSDRPPQP